MGKRVRTTAHRARFSDFRGLRLPALCIFFALGAVLGHIAAQLFGSDGGLVSYLTSISSFDGDEILSVPVISVLMSYIRYPLLVLMLGYCSFGVAAIPLLLAVQGFTLSFAATILATSLGRDGIVLALASFGPRSLITVFCTLLTALWAMEKMMGMAEKKPPPSGNVIAFTVLVLAVGVILELTVVPQLFSLALAALN